MLLLQDFTSPDVYETHSPSPTTRTRKLGQSNRGHASTSSEEDSDEEENKNLDERSGRKSAKKVGGQNEAQGSSNPDIVGTALNPEEAAKRFQDATGVDSRNVGELAYIQLSSSCVLACHFI